MPSRPSAARAASADRLRRRLACHQALHDPRRAPGNRSASLPRLRAWQAERLERSFAHHLADPARQPAARFFLTQVYGDHDFTRRDADIARVLPVMERLLPPALLDTVADGIALGALTQALDLRMAALLDARGAGHGALDASLYADTYRALGRPRLRARQIDLVEQVGAGLSQAVRRPGTGALLRLARGPARAMGLSALQEFLESGFEAFARLDDAAGFLGDVVAAERRVSRRLFAGDPDPFASAGAAG